MIVAVETTAISCVKKYHNGEGLKYFALAVLFYSLVCYLLCLSFNVKDSMGMVNVVWSGLSVLAVSLAGILLFKEKIHVHDVIAGLFITTGLLIFKYTE